MYEWLSWHKQPSVKPTYELVKNRSVHLLNDQEQEFGLGLEENRPGSRVKLWAAPSSGSCKMNSKLHCPNIRQILPAHTSDETLSLCIWQLSTAPSYLLRVAPTQQISPKAARGFVHGSLPGLSITLKLQNCPRSERAFPQHSCTGLGNSLCVLWDKQVIHKKRQEFISELPLQKGILWVNKQNHQCNFISVLKHSPEGAREAKVIGHGKTLHTNSPECQIAEVGGADGNSLKAQIKHFSLVLPKTGQGSLQEALEPHLCFHPLKAAMWEWKTQIPAQSGASTISGPGTLPKASLDLAGCSTTWERLSHTPSFRRETHGRAWTAESQECSFSMLLPSQGGPWITKEQSKSPRK